MMLHEEHHLHLQAKSSSRSSSKKNKGKKIPQRGLGVAQLEKLRIEEQQKTSSNMMGSSSSSSSPAVPLPLVLPVAPQQHLVTARDPSPLVRSAISHTLLPTVDYFKPGQIGFSDCNNTEEFKYLSCIWSDNLSNLNAADAVGVNQHQYTLPIRLVNNKSGLIPVASLSRINLQMEPPSNQNYSIRTSQPEEERIAGTNLPWPFHPETTAMSFPCKASPSLRTEEVMALHGKFEQKGTAFSSEGSNLCQNNWRNSEIHASKRLKENGAYADGNFLSLGTSRLTPLQSQGAIENATNISENSSEKPFYSFLPMGPTGNDTDSNEEGDNGVNGVDTSLKL